jgi:hypothetical protein
VFQPSTRHIHTDPVIKAEYPVLKVVDMFCYLGSVLSTDASIDDDMLSARLAKASAAYGKLTKRL